MSTPEIIIKEDSIQTSQDIQIAHISKILNKLQQDLFTLRHVCLLISNNGDILKHFLSDETADFVYSTLQSFANNVVRKQTKDISGNSHICKAIELILGNKCLRRFLESVPYETTKEVTDFIDKMKQFSHYALIKLMEPADKNKQLGRMFIENQSIDLQIHDIQNLVNKQKYAYNTQLHKKVEKEHKLEKKIQMRRDSFDMKVLIMNSEKTMNQQSLVSEKEQIRLKEQVKMAKQSYEHMKRVNLKQEKKLYERRTKIEATLISWMDKYDKDISLKETELDKLQEQYNDTFSQYVALKDKFEIQESLYLQCRKERAFNVEAPFDKEIEEFRANRAARLIQRFWRKFTLKRKATLRKSTVLH